MFIRGCDVHQLLSSVAEVKESTEHYVHGQFYRCNTAYIPMVRLLIRPICGVYIYIFAPLFSSRIHSLVFFLFFFFAWNIQRIYENLDIF